MNANGARMNAMLTSSQTNIRMIRAAPTMKVPAAHTTDRLTERCCTIDRR